MCVCVCVCVFAVPIYFHFFLAFVLINDLSLVSCCSCFGNAYDFVFVAVCFFLLYALCILGLLPCLTTCSFIDDLSLMIFHWGF